MNLLTLIAIFEDETKILFIKKILRYGSSLPCEGKNENLDTKTEERSFFSRDNFIVLPRWWELIEELRIYLYHENTYRNQKGDFDTAICLGLKLSNHSIMGLNKVMIQLFETIMGVSL